MEEKDKPNDEGSKQSELWTTVLRIVESWREKEGKKEEGKARVKSKDKSE